MFGRRRRRGRLAAVLAASSIFATACSGADSGVDPERAEPLTESSAVDAADPTVTEPGAVTGLAEELDDAALRIGLSDAVSVDPATANPASASDVAMVDLLYDTLTVLDDDGVAQPALASFEPNDDLTRWTFELDRAATFADGRAIVADDVVFSFERVLGEGASSLAALRLDHIESLVTRGTTTVEFVLDRPSAELPELLSSPVYGITNRAVMSAALAGEGRAPNTSSEYAVVAADQTRMILERRSGDGPAVVVRRFGSESDAVDAFLAGQLDWTIVPTDRLTEALRAAGDDGLAPFHGGLHLGVSKAVPPLDRPELRRAIALAINRQTLVESVFGATAQPLRGIVPAGLPGVEVDECRGVCGPDPSTAADIVASELPDGQERPLRLLVDNSTAQRTLADVLTQQLGTVGLDVEVESVPVATYEQLLASGQPQLFVFGALGLALTPADHVPSLFESSSPDNITRYSDEDVDAAIAAARTTLDPSERAAAWRTIEATILEQVPVVPLVQFRTTSVVSDRVSGLRVRADGSLDLSEVDIDG